MIDFNALFKVTYGLYIISSGNTKYGNGYISNTFFQVTAEPPKFASCCNKNNLTCELIEKHNAFSVTVLNEKTDPEIFGNFGYKSGRDIDKLKGVSIKYGETGVPIVLNNAAAILECRVVQKIDVGTHILFIGELINAEIMDDAIDPITYINYRNTRNGLSPKNAPTYIDKSKLETKEKFTKSGKHKCAACGYIHDDAIEEIPFRDLPTFYKCPICGAGKEDFYELE